MRVLVHLERGIEAESTRPAREHEAQRNRDYDPSVYDHGEEFRPLSIVNT
jgi:hypothetical protein